MGILSLKVIFRGWARNRICCLIAVLSLILGLTFSMLLIGFVMHEYQIADSLPDNDNLFLLQEQDFSYKEDQLKRNNSSVSVVFELARKYPEVKQICTFHVEQGELYVGEKKNFKQFYSVTSDFVDLFQPKLWTGDLKHTLNTPGEVAISRSYALRQFGKADPVGESFRLVYSKMSQGEKLGTIQIDERVTITAIIDDSEPGVLDYDLLMGLKKEEFENEKGSINYYYNFVCLDANVRAADFVQKVNQDTTFFSERRYKAPEIDLVSLHDVYYSDQENNSDNSLIITRDKSLLFIGWTIALAILFIACFNYVNISMTRAMQRLRVTGQQIVFGACRSELQWTLIMETGIQVLFAFLISLGLLSRILPVFNSLVNARLGLDDLFSGGTLWAMVFLLIVVTLLPSLYIFSRLRSASLSLILKQQTHRRSDLINGMVVAQFVVSIVLLILMLNIRQQMNFIAHTRPESEKIYWLRSLEETRQWGHFRDRLKEIPGIEQMIASSPMPAGSWIIGGKAMLMFHAGPGFYDFYLPDFIAGGPGMISSDDYTNIVVNETMVRVNGIQEPLGYEFEFNGKYRIAGVVRDFQVDNFSKTIQPLMIIPRNDEWHICLKIPEISRERVLDKVIKLWKEVEPLNIPLKCQSLAEVYTELHTNELRLLKIVSFFTWVSLLLTCLGLFGLAWFSVEKRRKEIGIRKINGATTTQVIVFLCCHFVKWVGCAFVVAVPIAYWLVDQWMVQFVYRAGIQIWTFPAAGLFVVSLGIATVIWQAWKVSAVNPVETVKNE